MTTTVPFYELELQYVFSGAQKLHRPNDFVVVISYYSNDMLLFALEFVQIPPTSLIFEQQTADFSSTQILNFFHVSIF